MKQAASVLEATARGSHGQGEIARSIGLSTAALVPHLKHLVALGYLERVFPLVPGRPPRTSVLYRVADPLPGIICSIIPPPVPLPTAMIVYGAAPTSAGGKPRVPINAPLITP